MDLAPYGPRLVELIRKELEAKGINATSKASRSLSFKVYDQKLEIWGTSYILFLQYGRAPGKRPPFEVIKNWVITKLNPPKDKVWIITDTICNNIAAYGTSIFKNKEKGLQLDLILADIFTEISDIAVDFQTTFFAESIAMLYEEKK